MAIEKKQANWMGHPVLSPGDEHELHLAAALYEFQGGLPRNVAEQKALEDYRKEWHARAASHHLDGLKAAQAVGDTNTAQKHHGLYSLHLKSLGLDPMGPVPEIINKYHAESGLNDKQRKVYNFKGHNADQFLVKPV